MSKKQTDVSAEVYELERKIRSDFLRQPIPHQHTWDTVTKWDYYSQRYNGRLDYSVALEVMCSGCLERKALEQKETEE